MKNTFILAGALVASTLSSQAQTVFTEDFDGQSFTHTSASGSTFGGGAADVLVEEWFGASNGAAINNELQLTNFSPLGRSRGAGIWLDSSAWTLGTVTVKFDILDYTAGGTGSESYFQAYFATGVNATDSVNIDVHAGGDTAPEATSTGSAAIGTIGARNTIAGNVTQATFTFSFTGQDNIALVFHNESSASASSGSPSDMPIYSIDNLTVAVPEPGTYALLAGLTGLAFVMLRRRA